MYVAMAAKFIPNYLTVQIFTAAIANVSPQIFGQDFAPLQSEAE